MSAAYGATGVYAMNEHGGSTLSDLMGIHKPQRTVTINVQISPAMLEKRSRAAKDASISDEKRYGTTISSGNGVPGDLLSINEFEPLFARIAPVPTGNYAHMSEPAIYGFQAVNAMVIPDTVETDDQVNNEYRCIGISMRPWNFSVIEQINNGVASAVSGSIPLWNNGKYPWHPGDRLVARFPSKNVQKRAADETDKPHIPGEDRRRMRPYIEPLRFQDERLSFESELTKSFNPDAFANYAIDSYLKANYPDRKTGGAERAAAGLRHFVAYVAFCALALYELKDGNAAALPAVAAAAGGRGLDEAQYNDFRARLGGNGGDDKMLDSVLSTLRANGGGAAEAFEARLLTLQAVLGLLPVRANAPGQMLKPATTFIEQINGLALHRFFTDHKLQTFFNVTRLFRPERTANALRASDSSGLGQDFNIDDPIGMLAYAQQALPAAYMAGQNTAIEMRQNRYVATAYEYAPRGKRGLTWRA